MLSLYIFTEISLCRTRGLQVENSIIFKFECFVHERRDFWVFDKRTDNTIFSVSRGYGPSWDVSSSLIFRDHVANICWKDRLSSWRRQNHTDSISYIKSFIILLVIATLMFSCQQYNYKNFLPVYYLYIVSKKKLCIIVIMNY